MLQKLTLTIFTILMAIVSIQFWSSDPAAGKAKADPLQQDSPSLSFDRALINVVEPDAGEVETLILNVVISEAPVQGEEVTVTGLSANGSAIAGIDYLAVAESLTFAAGSTDPQSFDVVIIGNNIYQPNRQFVVFLTNPVNATVSPPAAITIQILDDESPPPIAESWNFLPIIRGVVAGPTSAPEPPTPTRTPYSSYRASQ